jgi:biopolymer transport protein TolR
LTVLLVLIIICMVLTPKLPTGLPTLVLQPSPEQANPDPRAIVVQVMPGEKLTINQESGDWNSLSSRLSEIFKDRADKIAFVEGGTEVPFAQVARVIDIMRGAGIDRVGLITPATMSDE